MSPLHPAMGVFLSHLNNQKSDPINNTFPDENYAREVMQLFSIGLFELNPDGSEKTDASGDPIPTYDNDTIREFAKVFTGLSYGGEPAFFGNRQPEFREPMAMFDFFHETGSQTVAERFHSARGQTGMEDIEDAIDNLFNHPNVGPFIGRQLIQRLVTSNPTPAYVERVARVFNGDATGVRGDMQAVIRAVLLDPEADTTGDPQFGKLREPVVRFASMLRQFNAGSDDDFISISGHILEFVTRQHPLSSPSVFNFFLPAHTPAGEIAAANLVAPEFQITNSGTIVGISNVIDAAVSADVVSDAPAPFSQVILDMSDYVAIADDVDALIDRLDIVLTYGTASSETRTAIRRIVANIDDMEFRVRVAIYMFLISPDYAVRL